MTVAALIPKPASRIAAAASVTHAFCVSRRRSSDRSWCSSSSVDAADVGVEHADRLLEQLLAGLVAVEDDDPAAAQACAAEPLQLELVGALLERRDHEREVLVEVDAERLGALAQLVAVRPRRRTPASSSSS